MADVVRTAGVEPASLAAPAPKAGVSANSTTSAPTILARTAERLRAKAGDPAAAARLRQLAFQPEGVDLDEEARKAIEGTDKETT